MPKSRSVEIIMPRRQTFYKSTLLNANRHCSAMTVQRRLNEMIEGGKVIRISHGRYQNNNSAAGMPGRMRNDQHAESQNITSNSADYGKIKLTSFMRFNNAQKAHILEKVLEQLINEGVIIKKDNMYSLK